MEQRFIAKLVVLSTVAVMAFGLLSMAIAMSTGMGHCPVMRTSAACPSHTQGIMFFDHHVDGFQSMILTTSAVIFVALLIVFAYTRLGANRFSLRRMYTRERWDSGSGPPSPIRTHYFWSALHNKFGGVAYIWVREKMLA